MRKPGHREGVRRYQRYGQTTLDVGRTLDPQFSLDEEDDAEERAMILATVTCQSCGAYWDGRYHEVCLCGGNLG